MRGRWLVALLVFAGLRALCAGQAQPAPKGDARARARAEALREYAGHYELEGRIIPVTALDVTAEGGELWLKPTNARKRRLLRKSKTTFADEVEGTPVRFARDDEGRVTSLTFRYEGEEFTARRVELPPPSLRGNTTFRLKGHADARVVALAGSFNLWSQSQLIFGREGDEWVCRVDLDPGVYTYKFVVDGNWLLDPANPATQEDEAGNVNNVLEVHPTEPRP